MKDEVRWLTAAEAAIWTPYVVSSMHVLARLDDELKAEFDISHLDYGVMSQLSFRDGGAVRMSVLADRFGVSRSQLTYRVARLERMGLVERLGVPDDGRGVAVGLTEAGAALLARAAPMHVATVRRVFIDLLDPESYEVLATTFARLAIGQADDDAVAARIVPPAESPT